MLGNLQTHTGGSPLNPNKILSNEVNFEFSVCTLEIYHCLVPRKSMGFLKAGHCDPPRNWEGVCGFLDKQVGPT